MPHYPKTISWLRFPLAALIVLKHYYTPDISAEAVGGSDELMFYHYIGEFTQGVFPAIAVPLFFFISGYLYFNKLELTGTQGYSFSIWKKKTQGRIKSLLIPYLSWNLLVLALYYITQCLTGGSDVMTKDGYKLIADYGIADYAKAVYAIDSTGMPIDGPLWFIRDLFIVSVLITPPIWLIIKYLRVYGMILLTALFLMGVSTHLPGLSSAAIFYFAWGAYMSLHKISMGADAEGMRANLCGWIMLASLAVFTGCYFCGSPWESMAKTVYIFSAILCIFCWIGRWVKTDKIYIPALFSTASFFIFAFHKPMQVIVRRAFFAIVHPQQEWLLVAVVFLIPALVISIALGIFYLIKKYFPFLKFLNGYRL